jgi:hypothetical protein
MNRNTRKSAAAVTYTTTMNSQNNNNAVVKKNASIQETRFADESLALGVPQVGSVSVKNVTTKSGFTQRAHHVCKNVTFEVRVCTAGTASSSSTLPPPPSSSLDFTQCLVTCELVYDGRTAPLKAVDLPNATPMRYTALVDANSVTLSVKIGVLSSQVDGELFRLKIVATEQPQSRHYNNNNNNSATRQHIAYSAPIAIVSKPYLALRAEGDRSKPKPLSHRLQQQQQQSTTTKSNRSSFPTTTTSTTTASNDLLSIVLEEQAAQRRLLEQLLKQQQRQRHSSEDDDDNDEIDEHSNNSDDNSVGATTPSEERQSTTKRRRSAEEVDADGIADNNNNDDDDDDEEFVPNRTTSKRRRVVGRKSLSLLRQQQQQQHETSNDYEAAEVKVDDDASSMSEVATTATADPTTTTTTTTTATTMSSQKKFAAAVDAFVSAFDGAADDVESRNATLRALLPSRVLEAIRTTSTSGSVDAACAMFADGQCPHRRELERLDAMYELSLLNNNNMNNNNDDSIVDLSSLQKVPSLNNNSNIVANTEQPHRQQQFKSSLDEDFFHDSCDSTLDNFVLNF